MKLAGDPITEDEHLLVMRFLAMNTRYFCGRYEFFPFSVVFRVGNTACNIIRIMYEPISNFMKREYFVAYF